MVKTQGASGEDYFFLHDCEDSIELQVMLIDCPDIKLAGPLDGIEGVIEMELTQ